MKHLRTWLVMGLGWMVMLPAWGAPESLDAIVAWVDNRIITRSELDDRIAQIRKEHPEARGMQEQLLGRQVLDHLIEEQIQLQRADETGIRIDDLAVNDAIQEIAHNRGLSLDALKMDLEKKGTSFAQFREQVHQELVLSRLYQRDIMGSITISEQELQHYLHSPEFQSQVGLEYRIRHLLVPLPNAPSPADLAKAQKEADTIRQEITAGADFTTVAQAHAAQGGDLGWRKTTELPTLFLDPLRHALPHTVIGPLKNQSGFHVIMIEDRRIDAEKMPSELHLYQRQVATQAEAATLQKGSTLPEATDMGWIRSTQLPTPVARTVATLPIGEISAPVETPQGWQVFQVQARRSTDLDPVLRQYALQALQHRKFEEKLAQWVAQLRAEAYVVVQEAGS